MAMQINVSHASSTSCDSHMCEHNCDWAHQEVEYAETQEVKGQAYVSIVIKPVQQLYTQPGGEQRAQSHTGKGEVMWCGPHG